MKAPPQVTDGGSLLHCNPACQQAETRKAAALSSRRLSLCSIMQPGSGSRCDLGLALVGARAAGPAAGGLGLAVAFDHRDGRRDGGRQHVERDPLAFGLRRGAVDLAARAILTILAGPPLLAIFAPVALRPLGAEFAAGTLAAII